MLRPGLLDGVAIVLAAPPQGAVAPGLQEPSAGAAIDAMCTGLGARVFACLLGDDASGDDPRGVGAVEEADDAVEASVERALAAAGGIDLLVVDAAALFARAVHAAAVRDGSHAGRHALWACMDASWSVTRLVANRAFLKAGHGGRIVYVSPPDDGGEHAQAARAGLENLARTLSVEWARHSITTVAIAPAAIAPRGAGAGTVDVATLIAYLASCAGAYFSGCLLDLGGLVASA